MSHMHVAQLLKSTHGLRMLAPLFYFWSQCPHLATARCRGSSQLLSDMLSREMTVDDDALILELNNPCSNKVTHGLLFEHGLLFLQSSQNNDMGYYSSMGYYAAKMFFGSNGTTLLYVNGIVQRL